MTTTPSKANKSRSRVPLVGSLIAVGVVVILAFVFSGSLGGVSTAETQPTFTVREGPLTISVVESGTIKSLEQVSLKCEVEGQTTIIYLIPEGTHVQEGDLLVELDASNLQDTLIQQQISVDSADAAFVQARESLAVAKNQAESDISAAELDYQFAQEDVTQYIDGTHPKEVKEAESAITLAEAEMNRAEDTLKWSERLFAEKYLSQSELEADRLSYERTKLEYELAVVSLNLLNDFTSKRKLAELHSNVDQMKMALDRVKLQANADIVQAQAKLKAAETELEQQKAKLAKTQRQLDRTKIYAPREGLVVYATSVQGGGPRRREPLEEGQSVRERQELIYLPSSNSMMAQIQIHESSLEKVRVGMPARITVDAISGQIINGRVTKIAPLPDAESAWMNPDLKVYPTQIDLENGHPELRTGMNCSAEIIVEQYAKTVYVPIQAIVRVANQPTAYVRTGKEFKPRPVEIGLDNNSMIRIVSGLKAGEEVLLTPPLEAKHEFAEQTEPVEDISMPAATSQPSTPTPAAGANANGPLSGFGNMTAEQREEMRKKFESMTPEERQAEMQRRMENMTPEQRQRFEQMRRQRQSGGSGSGGGSGGGTGGGPGGGNP